MPRWYALTFHGPTSSAKMTTMLGGFAGCAAAGAAHIVSARATDDSITDVIPVFLIVPLRVRKPRRFTSIVISRSSETSARMRDRTA
jgi:hypothetical protein